MWPFPIHADDRTILDVARETDAINQEESRATSRRDVFQSRLQDGNFRQSTATRKDACQSRSNGSRENRAEAKTARMEKQEFFLSRKRSFRRATSRRRNKHVL